MARSYRHKTDGNQTQIIKELRQAGYSVFSTSKVGDGFPDIVVSGYWVEGKMYVDKLVEIKMPGGKLTPDEVIFHDSWNTSIITAYSAQDVIDWFQG